jgi:hypothetical protein
MEPLDGNAIGGQLRALFGSEMTDAVGACAACGTEAIIAELRVYCRCPGAVARCPSCGAVVFVLVEIRAGTKLVDDGFRWRTAQ